jgi:hypothetical protein
LFIVITVVFGALTLLSCSCLIKKKCCLPRLNRSSLSNRSKNVGYSRLDNEEMSSYEDDDIGRRLARSKVTSQRVATRFDLISLATAHIGERESVSSYSDSTQLNVWSSV